MPQTDLRGAPTSADTARSSTAAWAMGPLRSAVAANAIPQAVETAAPAGLRLDAASGTISDTSPTTVATAPAHNAASFQPSGLGSPPT